MEDLKGIDTTHGNSIKSHHPQWWDRPQSFQQHSQLDVLDSTRTIWIWSDQHFNHKNIIEYSKRPFPNVELMNECLVGNYNKVVQPNDVVIWCGDVTFGGVEELNQTLSKLPGYKIHILGNHDFKRGGKLNNLTFDECLPCLVLDVCNAEVEYQLLLTHYPLTIVPECCFNIHGHTHNHPNLSQRHFNISVEHTNYTPLNIKELVQKTTFIQTWYL
jgi:calcineurin-like phosphoesterase family protein